MSVEMSNIRKAIYIAYEKGYRVKEDGTLIGIKGQPLVVKNRGNQRYPTFSVNVGSVTKSGVFGIPVHRFAGYCFYGDEIFNPKLCIRHLDADTENVSKQNLVLGTHSENEHDKPLEVRSRVGRIARSYQERANNSKFTDDEVREIRKRIANGERVLAVANELNVTRQCIHLIVKRRNYANVV